MPEHTRIQKFFAPLTTGEPGSFNLTDDAAAITPPAGHQLVITTDSVIEGIHVLPGAMPSQFAQKLIRRNLSDIAAMGAKPWRYLLNLHTPANLPETWFAEFAATLAHEQTTFGMMLIGGDSTSGGERIHTTLACLGLIEKPPLLRSAAKPGDDLYVSGTIGDAALGLAILQQQLATSAADTHSLTARYHLPQPRLALGQALHDIVTACIDISDGLLADATHLAQASNVSITIKRETIPLSDAAKRLIAEQPTLWDTILSGGDDYELLFTASPSKRNTLIESANTLDLPITYIGNVTQGSGVMLLSSNNQPLAINKTGWEHP